jgi:hypothetical protein
MLKGRRAIRPGNALFAGTTLGPPPSCAFLSDLRVLLDLLQQEKDGSKRRPLGSRFGQRLSQPPILTASRRCRDEDISVFWSCCGCTLGDEGFTWTEAKIDKWIADPKAMIADSPMALAFQGVPMPPNGPTSSPI